VAVTDVLPWNNGDGRAARDIERLNALIRQVAEERRRIDNEGLSQLADDVGDQVGDILDERDVRLQVAGDPQAAEHLLAEAVRGGDRGGVEAGDRPGQPRPRPLPPLLLLLL